MGFYGPPTPASQGPCGFDRGWSLVAKSRVKKFGDSLCDGIRPMKSCIKLYVVEFTV